MLAIWPISHEGLIVILFVFHWQRGFQMQPVSTNSEGSLKFSHQEPASQASVQKSFRHGDRNPKTIRVRKTITLPI